MTELFSTKLAEKLVLAHRIFFFFFFFLAPGFPPVSRVHLLLDTEGFNFSSVGGEDEVIHSINSPIRAFIY